MKRAVKKRTIVAGLAGLIAAIGLGGESAWNLALGHPDLVSHLILVDAAGWQVRQSDQKPPLPVRLSQYRLGRAFVASIDNKPLIRDGLKLDVVDQGVLTENYVQRRADLQRFAGHRPILMSAKPGQVFASNARLAAIRVSTLILWGADDGMSDVAAAYLFKQAITPATLKWEAGERSGGDVAAFLPAHTA